MRFSDIECTSAPRTHYSREITNQYTYINIYNNGTIELRGSNMALTNKKVIIKLRLTNMYARRNSI